MPQVTVYIRREDIEAWKSLPSKAAFIREHLHGNDYKPLAPTVVHRQMNEIIPLDSLPSRPVPGLPPVPDELYGEAVVWDQFQKRWREKVE